MSAKAAGVDRHIAMRCVSARPGDLHWTLLKENIVRPTGAEKPIDYLSAEEGLVQQKAGKKKAWMIRVQ
jgi:hypothetical protein